MLLLRVITASIFAPLVIFAVIALEKSGFSLALAIIFIVALWEFSALAKLKSLIAKVAYIFTIVSITFFLITKPLALLPILIASFVWWLIALYWIVVFPKSSNYINKNLFVILANGLFLFTPAVLSLIVLHMNNNYLVLLLFGLIWAADIGAYFTGKAIGKIKLSPNVSPKKTVEGLVGGVILSLFVAGIYVFVSLDSPSISDYLTFGFLSIIISLASVIGDLFESVLKRLANVKDSGRLLPGHGGILDRIDSLTCAAPIFFLFFTYVL
jgi:phosphatidate cytidylyltransferase